MYAQAEEQTQAQHTPELLGALESPDLEDALKSALNFLEGNCAQDTGSLKPAIARKIRLAIVNRDAAIAKARGQA